MSYFAAALMVATFAQNPNPMDSIRRLPGYRPAADTTHYLSPERLRKYVKPAMQREWQRYIDRSDAQYMRDTAAMGAELRAAHMTSMARAPYVHDFSVKPEMTKKWFMTDTARRMADIIVSFQAPNGGWSKHVDFTQHPRGRGESYYAESADWEWISTIDNSSTTEEIRFLSLAAVNEAPLGTKAPTPDVRYEEAVRRGIDYLLASQMPNGCFPQVYPLEGSYHDALTYNDDAMVNVLRLLVDVGGLNVNGETAEQSGQAAAAVRRGVECILDSQVRIGGKLTIWGQQHDPLTLAPVSARSYELKSLGPQESATIVDFLMEQPGYDQRIARAVYSAVDWYRKNQIFGYTYSRYQLTKQDGAGPLWGRMIDLENGRPIMSNREGIKLYDWNKLTDRRAGYGWYTAAPAAMLQRFEQWAHTHPRPQ